MSEEAKRKRRLNAVRRNKIKQAKQLSGTAKGMAKSLTPWGAASMMGKIESSDGHYFIALLVAVAKDASDFIGVGSLPMIGTVVTFLSSITIGFLMFLAGAGLKRRLAQKMMRRFFVLIGGTMIEAFLFGINFLPIQTITVLIIYWMVLAERKQLADAKTEA